MPKAKQSKRRNTFDYNKDRKKLKKKFIKKSKPRIEDSQIRNAWDENKSTAKNLQDMGLSFDPNQAVPIRKQMLLGGNRDNKEPKHIVTKPYVLNKLQEEASLPERDRKTLSSDLIEFVQHMVREHKDDYKAMARDEKNYFQETPKQIRRKIGEYRRCHPQHYDAFVSSLAAPEPMAQ
ncbi:nucleolar protein 16 [Kryptolebias marmoratus]|uniref:Nucleolar protein 16 n=1 Tax=Kryptolebias marmoratus TaxID=37003 RepID=A0A3Q2ZW98_KRYMA|nr:nucleolar protein 16 [Kryptolebias marmoratus]